MLGQETIFNLKDGR